MKQIFYIICLLAVCAGVKAQNVGIGTTTPTSKLTVVNAGVGIEHNDGTISIKSVVGGGIAVWGTTSNHPLHLMSNNNTGQLVIMPTGVVGIGNANPTLAGLVTDKKVGAVNAMFGSNTTGLAFETNWPGVGFNSYYSNGRKFIASGYGGVIGFNPTNGYFTLASTAVSGAANAAATTTDILTATNTGNVGIGTSTPSAKLEINGTLKLTDGTQGPDKILTSDASGNASWKTAAYGNSERFQFVLEQAAGTASILTRYNLGTASSSMVTLNGGLIEIVITIQQPGLYHFDFNAYSFSENFIVSHMEIVCYSNFAVFAGRPVFNCVVPYITEQASQYEASCDKSFDMYVTSGQTFSYVMYGTQAAPSADSPENRLTISGHLIAP